MCNTKRCFINIINELATFRSIHKIYVGVVFKALEKLGVIPGYDMTGEAALTKLTYVIGLPGLTIDQKKQVSILPSLKTTDFVQCRSYKFQMMKSNLRGELTVI